MAGPGLSDGLPVNQRVRVGKHSREGVDRLKHCPFPKQVANYRSIAFSEASHRDNVPEGSISSKIAKAPTLTLNGLVGHNRALGEAFGE